MSERKTLRQHTAGLVSRTSPLVSHEVAEAAAGDELVREYETHLCGECRATLGTLFKAPEVQRVIREGCRAAIQAAVARVLDERRAEVESDVRLFVEQHWGQSVEEVARAVLADELSRMKSRIAGARR